MHNEQIIRQEIAQAVFKEASARWSEQELQRVRTALDVWSGQVKPTTHRYQHAAGFFIPNLRNEPWPKAADFPYIDLLLENYPSIRAEAQQFMNGKILAPPYGLADDAKADAAPKRGNPAGWSEWRLYRSGAFCEDRCLPFPTTTKTVAGILESTKFLMNATFLILEPGESLPPHYDRNNIFVNIWLPLEAPDGCFLTVADVTAHPKPGEILIFNHSYIHSAGNKGSTRRVVLSLSVFHPELTPVEREVIKTYLGGAAGL